MRISHHYSNRSVLLDCIRMVAISFVVGYHVAKQYDRATLDAVAGLFKYGFYGVDLFFPLSGFLITRFLIRSRRPDFVKVFFIRRVFRILPLYFAAVTVFLIASKITGFDAEIIDNIWITYTFLTGWFVLFNGLDAVPYTITWSLSVEEFAYLLFGIFAWISRRHFTGMLVVFILFPTALRFWLNAQGTEFTYFFPPARIDAIAIGGLTAVLMTNGARGLLLWYACASVFTLLLCGLGPVWLETFQYTLVPLATCILIIVFETRFPKTQGRVLTAMGRIGFYSYFIYLFNFFNVHALFMIVDRLGLEKYNFWIMAIVCYGLTYVQAAISYRIFEGPMIDFGRQLEQRHSAGGGGRKSALPQRRAPRD